MQRDFISLLPKELSLYVLSFLEPPHLLRAAQACRYWRILCEDNLLWREKCREEGLLEDGEAISAIFRRRLSHKQSARHLLNSQQQNSASVLCSSFNASPSSEEEVEEVVDADVSVDYSPASPASPGQHKQQQQSSPNEEQNNNSQFNVSEYKLAYLRHKSIEHNWRYGELNYSSNISEGDEPMVGAVIAPGIVVNNQQAQDVAEAANAASTKACQAAALPKHFKPRRLKEVLHLKGHEDHVITCLQFNAASNIIVSGSDDNTLKVWSSVSGRCLRTLTGHTGGVWSSQLSPENIVISGSTDRSLRVWDALTGHCLHTLYGHTSTVRCMALHGRYVVSGSRDATLRAWNIDTGACEHILVGHLAAVRCVQFNGTLCVSGAYDFLVKVWSVAAETCLYTLDGHTNRVYSLQFDGIHIVSGSLDTSIRVWSAETGKLKHTLIGHQSLTSGMQLRGNILVSGNADSTVKVWDINSGQCLQTLSGTNKHQSAVTCLQFNSNFVITSSDDGTVKLWDLKTGEFIRNLVSLPSGGSGGVVWRIRASSTKLVCAVGSRNGTEETKLLVLDFETPNAVFDYGYNFASSSSTNQTPKSKSGVRRKQLPLNEDDWEPSQEEVNELEQANKDDVLGSSSASSSSVASTSKSSDENLKTKASSSSSTSNSSSTSSSSSTSPKATAITVAAPALASSEAISVDAEDKISLVLNFLNESNIASHLNSITIGPVTEEGEEEDGDECSTASASGEGPSSQAGQSSSPKPPPGYALARISFNVPVAKAKRSSLVAASVAVDGGDHDSASSSAPSSGSTSTSPRSATSK